VDIWFKPAPVSAAENTEEEGEEEEEEMHHHHHHHHHQPAATSMIDRVTCLHPVLFDLFADLTADPPMLNYLEMVMSRYITLEIY